MSQPPSQTRVRCFQLFGLSSLDSTMSFIFSLSCSSRRVISFLCSSCQRFRTSNRLQEVSQKVVPEPTKGARSVARKVPVALGRMATAVEDRLQFAFTRALE